MKDSGKKIFATFGCSSFGVIVSAIIGALIAIVLALVVFGSGTQEWYAHNAALNNGEWAMFAGACALGFILIVIAIAGLIGAIITGALGSIVSLLASAIFFTSKQE
jgi:hypothetical protein